MKHVLAFDASLHATGWCFMRKAIPINKILSTGLIKVHKKIKGMDAVIEMSQKIFQCTKEFPMDCDVVSEIQKYRMGTERANINSLMNLHAIGVCCLHGSRNPYWYYPSEWKGSVIKKIHNLRTSVRFYLPVDEDNNILDAVGLAHFHLDKKYG